MRERRNKGWVMWELRRRLVVKMLKITMLTLMVMLRRLKLITLIVLRVTSRAY